MPPSLIKGLACFALLAPLVVAAQDTTFRMDVKLVNLFVNVTDNNGCHRRRPHQG